MGYVYDMSNKLNAGVPGHTLTGHPAYNQHHSIKAVFFNKNDRNRYFQAVIIVIHSLASDSSSTIALVRSSMVPGTL